MFASPDCIDVNDAKPVKIGTRRVNKKAKAKARKHRKMVKAQKRHAA